MAVVLQFHDFCAKVLKLNLTLGQRVIAKVAFGNWDPVDLPPEEQDIALKLFGGLDRVQDSAKKYVLMRLGRGSGKTTLVAAFALFVCLTSDLSVCGPGDTPYFIVVAPDKETAKLSIRMAREMARGNPAIERLVVNDKDQMIQIRRPDGRLVRIEAFAATRGGSAVRSRTIMGFLLEEAEFFTSSGEDRDYAVNDRDIFRALKPRLLPAGKGMMISTPWPVETLMGEMFDRNWGKCIDAVAILAPTLLVRGEHAHVVEMVEDELQKDPENARRELFCELDGFSGGEFFDLNALSTSKEPTQSFPLAYNPKWPTAIGCDLGFTGDSSAIVVVQYDGKYYRMVHADELRPKPGKPLKPSEVIGKFITVVKRYGAAGVVADSHYKEVLREHLTAAGLTVFNAPEGSRGKSEVYQRARAVTHEGLVKLPESAITNRLINQAKMVTSKAAPGGSVTIRTPRKIGMGHGDIVSAWVLAVHRLAHSRLQKDVVTYEPGSPEWFKESSRRLLEASDRQQSDYLKRTEAVVRKGMNERRYRELFKAR